MKSYKPVHTHVLCVQLFLRSVFRCRSRLCCWRQKSLLFLIPCNINFNDRPIQQDKSDVMVLHSDIRSARYILCVLYDSIILRFLIIITITRAKNITNLLTVISFIFPLLITCCYRCDNLKSYYVIMFHQALTQNYK